MKAFVTGATGFIGQNLVAKLISDKWQVTVLSTDHKEAQKIFKGKKLKIIHGDLTKPLTFKNKINADVIFNLAGALPHHHAKDEVYEKVNIDGVKNLLLAVKDKHISRFVHVSTVGIYGTQNKIIQENSKLKLETIYAKSKYEGEKIVKEFYSKHKVPVVIIKPTIAYGPRDIRPGFKDLFKLINKKQFLLVGNGENHFHTIYVENLIDALLKAAIAKKAIGEDFIIGDDPCPKMKDIVSTISKVEEKHLSQFYLPLSLAKIIGFVGDLLKLLGLPAPLFTTRVKFITDERKYSTVKAEKVLKWKPKVNLEKGITKTYQWYLENKIIS